ncbi:VIPAS39 family protein [Megaselia abdita]
MDSAEAYWNCSSSNAFSFDDDDVDGKRSSKYLFDDDIPVPQEQNQETNSNIHDIISDEDLKMILDEQSLDSYTVPKGISPEDELKLLRRRLQYVLHSPSIRFTLHKLMLGKKCLLEAYKSLEDKERLLVNLIETRNGDGILAVLIFLSKTLNERQFNRILLTHPDACDIYVNFLIEMKYSKAIELLTMMGRSHDSSMLQIKTELAKNNRQKLRQLLNEYVNSPGVIPIYCQILNNAISLSELLESQDNLSPVEVLYKACSRHSWKDQNLSDPWSPYKLMNEHQISPIQFEWVGLNERARAKAFMDLEGIFEKTSFLVKQKQFHISFNLELAILRLLLLEAPQAVLYLFLSKVTNNSRKLALARQVKCNKAVVDSLVALKELPELEKLKLSLSEGTEDFFYCEQSIKNLGTKKWTNSNLKLLK